MNKVYFLINPEDNSIELTGGNVASLLTFFILNKMRATSNNSQHLKVRDCNTEQTKVIYNLVKSFNPVVKIVKSNKPGGKPVKSKDLIQFFTLKAA